MDKKYHKKLYHFRGGGATFVQDYMFKYILEFDLVKFAFPKYESK
jgi:hypothetical protein